MSRSGTVGGTSRAAWVTRAEAAFLARVPVEEIDRLIASGRVAHRRVGALVLIDPAWAEGGPRRPAEVESRPRPPAEVGSTRGARARVGLALPRPPVLLACVAGGVAVALLVLQLALFGGGARERPEVIAAAASPAAPSSPPAIPVGRDPFASPFGGIGEGDRHAAVLVKPPGVIREGGAVTAAATVVNRSSARWLPPSEVIFLARDDTGRVIARATTSVSLGPDRAETVIVPDLAVDPSAIAAIEARIDAAPMRSGRYHAPSVEVAGAEVTEGGRAISGTLDVERGTIGRARLGCAVYDSLDELAGVSTTTVDLSRARRGLLRFWLTAQPATAGPYRVSCSAY